MEHKIQYPFQNDHDVLVAIIQEFNDSVDAIKHSMEDDHKTTLEVKALVEKQYQSLADRIDTVEEKLKLVDPHEIAQLKKDVRESKEWISGFNKTKHIAWIIAAAGFSIMGHYVPEVFIAIERLFGLHK